MQGCQLLRREPLYQRELKQAEKLYGEKKYTEALQHYQKVLELKQNNPQALLGLAQTHVALNNFPTARQLFKRILALNPSSPEAQRARTLLQTLPVERLPIQQAKKKIEDLLLGRKLEGIKIPKVTKETESLAFSFFQKGEKALRAGRIDFAIGLLNKATELNPSFAPAHVALGVAFMKKRLFDNAVKELRDATRLDPANVAAQYNLGLIFEGQGKWELARNAYMQVIPLDVNNPLIYTRLGLVFMELGLPSAAVDVWRIASTIDPHFVPARLLLAKAYADVGPAAFVPITFNLSFDSETHTLQITRQAGQTGGGGSTGGGTTATFTFYDAAIGEYRSILEMAPKLAAAYYGLGTTYARAVQNFVPILYFDQKDHRDPYDGSLRARMSPEEMLEQAIANLRRAVHLDPQNVIYRVNLGVAFAEAGDLRQALKQIQAALALNRNLLAARGVLGVLLSYAGQLRKSAVEYGQVGAVHPDVVRAVEALNALQPSSVSTSPMMPPLSSVPSTPSGGSPPFGGSPPTSPAPSTLGGK